MDEFLRHPITVGVLIILLTGVIVYLVRFHLRTAQTMNKLDEFIIPHFMPPKPGEEDFSLPGQVREVREETEHVRRDLREHMHLEEQERRTAINEQAKHRSLLRKVARAVGIDPDA